MSGRALPVRFSPLPDELFSSWFVRLAHANGEKVHSLAFKAFGGGVPRFVNMGDMDRGRRPRIELALADLTGVAHQRVVEATLAGYVGFLWGEMPNRGYRRWILPVVDRRSSRIGYGLQACTECLREPIPYFRRSWRLAFQVLCPYHGRLLFDQCPGCGQPLAIHRGDVGMFTPGAQSSARWCAKCGADLAEDFGTQRSLDTRAIEFQYLLLDTLRRGWINVGGRVIYSVLFFEGLHMLWSFLDAPEWSGRMRRVLADKGVLLASGKGHRWIGVGVRRLDLRYELLAASAWLLEEWPTRFLSTALQAKISSLKLLHFSLEGPRHTPFWLWSPVHEMLDRTMYVPSDQEIENAVTYLRRTLDHVRVRDACRILNMSTNYSRRVAMALKQVESLGGHVDQ